MTAHPTSGILQLKLRYLYPVVEHNGTSETWATDLSLWLHSPDWGLHRMVWGSCAHNRKTRLHFAICIQSHASKLLQAFGAQTPPTARLAILEP